MMEFKKLISKNIFPIEITDGKNCGKWMIYMPLVRYAQMCSLSTVHQLEKSLEHEESARDPELNAILNHANDERRKLYETSRSSDGLLNLMILPNNKCNFQCSYCYSAHGRSNVEISLDTLKAGLQYFFNSERSPSERLTISVLGGGEPLLSWHIVKPALEYAIEINSARGTALPISLVTNGSIINEDIMSFCRQHKVSLSVSFDLLEDVQNKQRGHYKEVCANINKFAEELDVAINTVITNDNVTRMEEMIEVAHQTIPNVKKFGLKSLISNAYFPDHESRKHYYRDFVDHFFKARRLAKQYDMYFTSPYLQAVSCVSDRFCPGKFVITAEGTLSICHCVSSKRESLYDKFIFGTISEDGYVSINHDKLNEFLSYDMYKHERCVACCAKWHCAGGCYADNCYMTEEERLSYCDSMRYFLTRYLQESFNF